LIYKFTAISNQTNQIKKLSSQLSIYFAFALCEIQ